MRQQREPRSSCRTLARRAALGAAVAIAGLTSVLPATARADDGVKILVLREQATGSAATAQGFVDKLVVRMAAVANLPAASGKYFSSRDQAAAFITRDKPHFGIISLGAFLALRSTHNLSVVGKVELVSDGGRQYHLAAVGAGTLDGCKGKRLVSNHFGDARFVDKVVFAGAVKLADFTQIEAKRPVQVLKMLESGEADCALIDDAQLSEAKKGGTIKAAWSSKKLPPMVVVAFPSAPAAEKTAFSGALGQICDGEGKTACKEAGISAMKSATAAEYADVVAAYD